jgi:hypothetical protein
MKEEHSDIEASEMEDLEDARIGEEALKVRGIVVRADQLDHMGLAVRSLELDHA